RKGTKTQSAAKDSRAHDNLEAIESPANFRSKRSSARGLLQCQRNVPGLGNAAVVKLVYCITRRSDLTSEEFLRYWRDVHGPIGARIPGLRRLVQSQAVRIPGDAHAPDFDGMAELWFDDVASLLAARRSPEWQ